MCTMKQLAASKVVQESRHELFSLDIMASPTFTSRLPDGHKFCAAGQEAIDEA